VESSKIETLLNNFIIPLTTLADANGRIHASLNINTETGRLSSRRPNLQNQPSVEKDRYKIRKVLFFFNLRMRLLLKMFVCLFV